MSDQSLGLAIGGVDESHAGRIAAAPRPIIPGIGEELAGLGPSASRIEHRRRRLVREQPNSLGEAFSLSSSRSCTGRSRKAARPTQSAKVERSRATPWRA
jgi:hypothetical protein